MTLKKLTLIIALLFFHFGGFAQSSAGLIAHWPFNGNSNDVTGNGHHGTSINTSNAPGRSGAPNTAYYFNGSNSYVGATYQSDLNVTSYTILAVMKPMGYYAGTCQNNFLFTRGSDYTSGNYSLQFTDNPFNDCSIMDTTLNVLSSNAGFVSGNPVQWQHSGPYIETNKWYAVAVSFDGNDFKAYINGALKATLNKTGGSIGSSMDSIWIGGNYGSMSYPYWFKGYMDDLRLYNRVLADSEIVEYYTNVTLPSFNTSLCINKTFNLAYNIEGTFKPGNIFTVELSDATGSFTTPTIIGTAPATTAGIIGCTIPTSITPGSGYLVRIVASKPAKTSDPVNVTIINNITVPAVTLAANPSATTGINASVTMGNTITFKATVAPAGGFTYTYTWRKNGTVISGATTDTYTSIAGTDFINNDTITVTCKIAPTCATTDTAKAMLRMLISAGVNDVNNAFNTAIYPNPNNGNFTLKGYIPVNGDMQINVLNMIGQTVYTKDVTVSGNSINEQISLSGLAAGIYNVKLQTTAGSKTMRITVQ